MTWLRRLFNRDRLESQLDAELRDHFDRLVSDFIAQGRSPHEARRLARLEFGGMDQVKEACRDARGTRWVEEVAQDIRYSVRGFRRQPGFTAVAILTLALGAGANLAIFNIVNAVLLRPLAVPDAGELITLTRWLDGNSSEHFSYPQVRRLADEHDLFGSLTGIATDIVHVGGTDSLQPAGAVWVSGGYYDTLRLTPFMGRLLGPGDDEPGAQPAAVVSHGYWQRQLGGDPSVIGRTLTIEGQPVPIIGISPPGFDGATVGEPGDITLAIQAKPILQPENDGRLSNDARWIRILARPQVSLNRDQVQARLDVVWASILADTLSLSLTPEVRQQQLSMTLRTDQGRTGTNRLRRNLQTPLLAAMALVTLVFVIACVNVANLLLARGAHRSREVALRLAIGAGRTRIFRQRLIESVLLAAAGTGSGVAVAWLAGIGLRSLIAERVGSPDGLLMALDITPDARVLMALVAMIAGIALVSGIAPAWRASSETDGMLTFSGRVAESHGRLTRALIVAQLSLSLLLVIGAGMFTRSLSNLRDVDRGFVAGSVLLARYDPSRLGLSPDELRRFNQAILDDVATAPGVRAATLAAVTPLQGGGMGVPMVVNGVSTGVNDVYYNLVGPRFFEILGTPLLAGRDLAGSDDASAPRVAVVNEAFVRAYLPDVDPVGQRVEMPRVPEMTIVGVVKDAVYETLRAAPPATVYVPFMQVRGRPMTIVVDASGQMAHVSAAIRRMVQPRVPSAPIRFRSFASQIEGSLFEARLMRLLSTIFGSLALALAAIGLYGLMSYNVALRTREMGVRLALGARPARLLGMILRDAIRMVAIGVAIGLPMAWALSRLVARMTFGLQPTDTASVAAAIAILVAAAIAAALLPARRAANVDPVASMYVE